MTTMANMLLRKMYTSNYDGTAGAADIDAAYPLLELVAVTGNVSLFDNG
jgi:hypothetical protein